MAAKKRSPLGDRILSLAQPTSSRILGVPQLLTLRGRFRPTRWYEFYRRVESGAGLEAVFRKTPDTDASQGADHLMPN